MDKLDEKQRAAAVKLATERLRIKLAKSDLDEQVVADMTRDQLLEAYAKLVVAGLDEPVAAAKTASAVGYDVELERQQVDLEKLKFEAEFAWKKQELEVAERNRIELLELQKKRERREDQERKDFVQIAQARTASKTRTVRDRKSA